MEWSSSLLLCYVLNGGPSFSLYSPPRAVLESAKHGNTRNRPMDGGGDLLAKAERDGNQSRFGQPPGSADPWWVPLSSAFMQEVGK